MDVIKPKLIKSKNPVNMEVMMNQAPGVNIVDGQANIREEVDGVTILAQEFLL